MTRSLMADNADSNLPEEGDSLDPSVVTPSEDTASESGLPTAIDLSSIPDTLPLLPTEDSVLYPFTIVPLAFDDPQLIAAVDEAMRGERMVGVVLRRSSDSAEKEEIAREDLHDVGTVAVIHRLVKHPEAGMRLLVQGVSRFRIVELRRRRPYCEASVLVLPEASGVRSDREVALLREGYDLADQVIRVSPYLPDELQRAVRQLDDAVKFSYMVASMLQLDREERQRILETDDAQEKLSIVIEGLRRELNVLAIGGQIKSQVDEEIQKKQREYYLREQLKAIREELGEGGDEEAEITRLRQCLETADVPDYVMEAAEEQLERLANIPSASPEYSVILSYLDWLCDVPWSKSTEDHLELGRAREILDEDHYDLTEVKDRILEYLAVRKLKADMKGPILCFVGPPGVGKTSLGRSIARAMGREFVRMSLGGMRDEAEIRGHRRTYIGAMPGRVVQSLKIAGTNNPVFMLDEVDKIGADFRGDPSSALLEVLDPEQNDTFRDHYLDLPLDLSRVLFIATANMLDTIQPALQDRMEIIRLAGYTDREKVHIARQYLVPKQLEENGLTEEQLDIDAEALEVVIESYTREAGVRNLEREIGKICRKVATRVAGGDVERVQVGKGDVPGYLGPRKAFHEVASRVARPGVATGLAWTSSGGEILFIEASRMPGSKGFTLTGKLGDVMQESARAALGYIRSHTAELGIEENFFDKSDIHLHVPAGAVPKDGPSAGVTMAAALASALTDRKVRPDVAMTGEITLTGQVLPVGGIKEKLVAARRSDIKTVILPSRNREHVEEVDRTLLEGLEFVYAETIGDVLEAALMKPARRGKKSEAVESKIAAEAVR
ncbi:MAG TPA: endopeptidase La [Gemmatimonadota bacterium]|nr:endopeptidase La [Gemmatimonadota bacterium]